MKVFRSVFFGCCLLFLSLSAFALPMTRGWAEDPSAPTHDVAFVLPAWGSSSADVLALFPIPPLNNLSTDVTNGSSTIIYSLHFHEIPVFVGYSFIKDQFIMAILMVVYPSNTVPELLNARYDIIQEHLVAKYGEPTETKNYANQWISEDIAVAHFITENEKKELMHMLRMITQDPALQVLINAAEKE